MIQIPMTAGNEMVVDLLTARHIPPGNNESDGSETKGQRIKTRLVQHHSGGGGGDSTATDITTSLSRRGEGTCEDQKHKMQLDYSHTSSERE